MLHVFINTRFLRNDLVLWPPAKTPAVEAVDQLAHQLVAAALKAEGLRQQITMAHLSQMYAGVRVHSGEGAAAPVAESTSFTEAVGDLRRAARALYGLDVHDRARHARATEALKEIELSPLARENEAVKLHLRAVRSELGVRIRHHRTAGGGFVVTMRPNQREISARTLRRAMRRAPR